MSFNSGKQIKVGELRPSQLLTTFGVGAMQDLPYMSVLTMGLDDWPGGRMSEVTEQRLLRSVRQLLGPQVASLRLPPPAPDGQSRRQWFDPAYHTGVPVTPFPRWLVCSRCRLLAPIKSGFFESKIEPFRPDRARWIHTNCEKGKQAIALPARFLVSCPNGHLDDFPWVPFVHHGRQDCEGPLRMYEVGPSGEAVDVEVKCDRCNAAARMAQAFRSSGQGIMPPCNGRYPHLKEYQECDETSAMPVLLGASNLWFPILYSVLSVPKAVDELAMLVDENWGTLEKATTVDILKAFRDIGQLKDFSRFEISDVWSAVEAKRSGDTDENETSDDLKEPEWQVFAAPGHAGESRDFTLRPVEPPSDFVHLIDEVVLVERLREVRALVGFTRIESSRNWDTPLDIPSRKRVPLSRGKPRWVPATETRGEGIFIRFNEDAIHSWETRLGDHAERFRTAHCNWRRRFGIEPEDGGWPGIRYMMLHTFAHGVIRQLSVECGYTTASLAERIYARDSSQGSPMAGVLIYTAAADSEGTLGGLCALGRPGILGRHIQMSLERMRFCASDPLCSEHDPVALGTLHGAACHACSYLPETSCERGNKYLDRALVVKTVQTPDTAFFE